MIFLVSVFLFYSLKFYKSKSLSFFITLIVLFSIILSVFLGRELEIENIYDLLVLFLMIFFMIIIILPWKNYRAVSYINVLNPLKVSKLTNLLVCINSFVFVIFFITSYVVMTAVSDINEFKYGEGVSKDFYYTLLPFNVTFFNIANLFYYSAYFLLPLHFYYLYKRRYWISFVCFLLSLNIVLYGLTFFSRAVVIQYLLMYSSFYWLLNSVIERKVKKKFKVVFLLLGFCSLAYFAIISIQRFEDDSASISAYVSTIPQEAIVQDPVLYSYLDYSSQWVFNGYEIMKKYEGDGFNGQITFNPLLSLLNQFQIFPYDSENYSKLRKHLWPDHYSYSFNGFAAYTLYDYGLFFGLIFCFLYYRIVIKMSPKNNIMRLNDLFLLVLLVQIPLMSIFYSQMVNIVIGFLIWLPINSYLKYKIN